LLTGLRDGPRSLATSGLTALVVVLLASFAFAATAAADPGAPNLDEASSAVYPDPDPTNGCSVDMTDEQAKQDVGEEPGDGPCVLDEGDGGGDDEGAGASVSEPPSTEAESGEASLAFTGMSAPVLLAISLLLIGAGLILRRVRFASSPSHH